MFFLEAATERVSLGPHQQFYMIKFYASDGDICINRKAASVGNGTLT